MKHYFFILILTCLVAFSCGNESQSKSSDDSLDLEQDSNRMDNLDNNNSGAGDTASYNRMSQKIADSIHR
ncbi:MAG TPA: hypothetical protein VI461_12735 [Chitinophagaceae bacterium]|nr:hypothetical protein [Chitinophagaceae bacterium]